MFPGTVTPSKTTERVVHPMSKTAKVVATPGTDRNNRGSSAGFAGAILVFRGRQGGTRLMAA
jgi:hypothetical protein